MQNDIAMLRVPATERARFQKGSVLVEFAIILPLFLALLFGVISFSVALYNKTVLNAATREGARAGILYVAGQDNDDKETIANAAAMQVLQGNLISFGSAMTPAVTASIDGDILTVTASGNFMGIFVFSDMSLSAQTSMRIE